MRESIVISLQNVKAFWLSQKYVMTFVSIQSVAPWLSFSMAGKFPWKRKGKLNFHINIAQE